MYEDGEDVSKAVYIAKIDEIRMVAGPIAQRYFDKQEEERQASQAKYEAEASAKRAEIEAAKRAAERANEGKVPEKKEEQAPEPQDMDIEQEGLGGGH